jgi:DNA-binding LytR/AlgR family response regulator
LTLNANTRALAVDEPRVREIKAPETRSALDLIVLKTPRGLRFEPTADVEWLEANRNYVIFCIRGERVSVRTKLSDLESKLDPVRFLRISRSSMVNLAHVKQAHTQDGGQFVFEMRSGVKLPCSRTRSRLIRNLGTSVRRHWRAQISRHSVVRTVVSSSAVLVTSSYHSHHVP